MNGPGRRGQHLSLIFPSGINAPELSLHLFPLRQTPLTLATGSIDVSLVAPPAKSFQEESTHHQPAKGLGTAAIDLPSHRAGRARENRIGWRDCVSECLSLCPNVFQTKPRVDEYNCQDAPGKGLASLD